jgi:hypothetical protein
VITSCPGAVHRGSPKLFFRPRLWLCGGLCGRAVVLVGRSCCGVWHLQTPECRGVHTCGEWRALGVQGRGE